MRTPTTDDALHKEAVDLCTDLASLLLRHRSAVRPADAYRAAMESVRIAGRILAARSEALPWEAAARYHEARTAALRVLVALDRAGAFAPLPAPETGPLQRRFHELAQALGALGGAG